MYRYIYGGDARKEMFEHKAAYAENKARENIQIATENGMSEEQAYAIADICKYRHDIHMTDGKSIYVGNDHISEYISNIETLIADTDLPFIQWSVDAESDWMLDSDYEYGALDSDLVAEAQEEADREGKELSEVLFEYGVEYNTKTIDAINKDIENWLMTIDEKYGTSFCPTGFSRLY